MECPLCKKEHPLLVRGYVADTMDTTIFSPVEDRGYAFCNCRNIFYTDWANIDQRIYDESYSEKYQSEELNESFRKGFEYYYPIISELKIIKRFCEIGAINSTLLDEAKKKDWETIRLDINPASTDENHTIVTGDIENPEISIKLKNIDMMWMSHVVEHLKDPLLAMENVHRALTDNGLVFVSMPDPYFIDWHCVSQWGHWTLREHHIMWDLDSFIEAMEELGFECVYSKRYVAQRVFVCLREFHTIFRKKKQ